MCGVRPRGRSVSGKRLGVDGCWISGDTRTDEIRGALSLVVQLGRDVLELLHVGRANLQKSVVDVT